MNAATQRSFASIARELQFLRAEQIDELTRLAQEQQVPIDRLALRMGMLSASDLTIIETLLEPDDSLPGFEILGLIGRGGMGVIYRARQKSLNRIVALKTVLVSELSDPTGLQRFEQEAVALARLTHPHIVSVIDFGKHRGRLFFAMELVVGEDCERFVQRHGRLDPFLVWGIIRQAAAGLAYAASVGIVHRDIKPANLLLVEPPLGFPLPAGVPLVKIADFGLAQLTQDVDGGMRTRLTQHNATVGSPHYMAPEQLNESHVDHRTDIYALGVTAWHLLAGRPPHDGKPLTHILSAKLTGELPSLNTVREALPQSTVDLVCAMVRRDPDERISSYAELLQRIDALNLQPTSLSHEQRVEHVPANVHHLETVAFSRPDTNPLPPQTAPSPQPLIRKRSASRTVRHLAMGAAALGIVAAVIWTGVRLSDRIAKRDLAPTHQSTYLFRGNNISDFQILRGVWYSGVDDENAPVLIGERGAIARALPAKGHEFYRLEFGVRLRKATAVEMHFDLKSSGRRGPSSALRITSKGAQLGRYRNQQSVFSELTPLIAIRSDPEQMHDVRLERHTHHWWVWVDGALVGTVPNRGAPPAQLIQLRVENGPAWFSDFIIEPLVSSQTRQTG